MPSVEKEEKTIIFRKIFSTKIPPSNKPQQFDEIFRFDASESDQLNSGSVVVRIVEWTTTKVKHCKFGTKLAGDRVQGSSKTEMNEWPIVRI